VITCSTRADLARLLAAPCPAILRVDPRAVDVRRPTFMSGLGRLSRRVPIVVQLTRDDDACEAQLLARRVDVVRATATARVLAARLARATALRLEAAPAARRGPLELDAARLVARVDGADLGLSSQPFRLLFALVRAAGAIVSRGDLLRAIDYPRAPGYDLLGPALRRLRAALGPAARLVRTEPGLGVRLASGDDARRIAGDKVFSIDTKSFPLRTEVRTWLLQRAADVTDEGDPPASARRAAVLLALDDGLSPVVVAARTRCCERSVRQLRARYVERGVACVDDAPRSGRPREEW
jgi:hypothetical protein